MPVQIKLRWGIRHCLSASNGCLSSVYSAFSLLLILPSSRLLLLKAFSPFRYIAKYRFHTNSPSFFPPHDEVYTHVTHHLALSQPYATIQQSYSTNRRRNLKKSRRYAQHIIESHDIVPLSQMFEQHTVSRIEDAGTAVLWDEHNIVNLYAAAQHAEVARLCYVVDEAGEYLAGGLYLIYHQKVIYYFGSATPRGLAWQSMTYMMDGMIRRYAGTSNIFDFEGSPDPGVARFCRSFGSYPVSFYEIQLLRLPKILRQANELRRRWQRNLM